MTATAKPIDPKRQPIINNPYAPPDWHWPIDRSTHAFPPALEGRRRAQYIPPVAGSRARQAPGLPGDPGIQFPTIDLAQTVRDQAGQWRKDGYPGATTTTIELLEHWYNEYRENDTETPLYFAQLDAVISHIFVHEAPDEHAGEARRKLAAANAKPNKGMNRVAHKMATGTGKTLVMAMIILWQAANHRQNPDDSRFTGQFLCITPGITVKERLEQALLPNNAGNEYQTFSIAPQDPKYDEALFQANVKIVNRDKFRPPSDPYAPTGHGKTLIEGGNRPFGNGYEESTAELLQRIGMEQGAIFVINDEGHHCHPGTTSQSKAKKSTDDNTLWHNALLRIHHDNRLLKAVDMSATPVYITQSTPSLFEWIISEYSLIDAMEAGLVKIPMVPTLDGADQDPKHRDIYGNTHKQDRKFEPDAPSKNLMLKEALAKLHAHYRLIEQQWNSRNIGHHPVLAVVMDTIFNANAMYEFISQGKAGLTEFYNLPGQLPNTIIIHSKMEEDKDDSDTKMKRNVQELAELYKIHQPYGFAAEDSTSQVMRAALNTVGKPGMPGEKVRCIISVNMLTEGWDAKTVTHMLGFRAFGSALLCEQVAGRTLRRVTHDLENDLFPLETAYILGIPFPQFGDPDAVCPVCGEKPCICKPQEPIDYLDVRQRPGMDRLAVNWPNAIAYSRATGNSAASVEAKAQPDSRHTPNRPPSITTTTVESIPGTEEKLSAPENRNTRNQFLYNVSGRAARMLCNDLEQDWDDETVPRTRIFCQFLEIAKSYIKNGWLKPDPDGRWPADELRAEAAASWLVRNSEKRRGEKAEGSLLEIRTSRMEPWLGTGDMQEHQAARNPEKVYENCEKSHINHAICDSNWEVQTAEHLDRMPEVVKWARNHRLGWTIPYLMNGRQRRYYPDFVAVCPLPQGWELSIVIEVKGEEKPSDPEKRRYAEDYWVPAVNRHPEYGRQAKRIWRYLYLPESPLFEETEEKIREMIQNAANEAQQING